MDTLLSRFAEDSYWMARYVERAESLARIIDVTRSFGQTSDTNANWGPVLDLFEDRKNYRNSYGAVVEKNVIRFYLLDRNNPNSIASSIECAHNNARTLRHLISVEMWTLINIFATRLTGLRARDISGARLTPVCESIKHDCQLFQGSTLNTLYRDQVWHFYRIGRLIERCDQTVRLVDIKTRPITRRSKKSDIIDVSQWHSLLRAASAYHGYLRAHPRELTAQTVAGFVLLDPGFPGSSRFCVNELGHALEDLKPLVSTQNYQSLMRRWRDLKRSCQGKGTIEPEALPERIEAIQQAVLGMHQAFSGTVFARGEVD